MKIHKPSTLDKLQNIIDNYTIVRLKMMQVLKGRNYLTDDNFTDGEMQQILQLKILETNYEAEIVNVIFEDNKERVQSAIFPQK